MAQLPGPRGLYSPAEYLAVVKWMATPKSMRKPETQGLLSEQLGICQATICAWRKRPGFWDDVRREMLEWAKGETPSVLNALKKKAVKTGNAHESRLWLEFVEEFGPKAQTPAPVQVNVFGENWERTLDHIARSRATESSGSPNDSVLESEQLKALSGTPEPNISIASPSEITQNRHSKSSAQYDKDISL